MDNIELKPFLNIKKTDRIGSTSESPIYSLFDKVWETKNTLQYKLVRTNFEKHDDNHFETTLTYKKLSSEKKQIREYNIDFYFFVPGSIISETFSTEKFLARLTNHMRLRSPEIPPSEFLDTSSSKSPLGRLNQIKCRVLKEPDLDLGKDIIREFRIAAIYILSSFNRININHLAPTNYDFLFHYQIELAITRDLLKNFRLIIRDYNSILANKFKNELEKCSIIEEYLSMQAERCWLSLLESETLSKMPEFQQEIRNFLNEEYKYRKNFTFFPEVDYQSLNDEREGELFSYRLGVLKKFIQEQLYLKVKYKNNSSYAIQSAAMIAAGFAGVFAYSIELLNRGYFGFSWEYNAGFLLTVSSVAYILKDRIKEFTRALFQRKWRRYDLRRDLQLADKGKRLARTIEKIEIIDPEKVPTAVLNLRNQTDFSSLKEHRSEKVIHYSKKVSINWNQLQKRVSKSAKSLKEIYRFDMSSFLRLMDNSQRSVKVFDPKTEMPVELKVPRVYHINCLLNVKPIDGSSSSENLILRKVRLVMDKSGIKRLELL